jgi:hypothetical protein
MRLVRIVVSALLLAVVLVLVPRPAAACACGAVISNSSAAVSGETALVSWDGTTESIDMVLKLKGSAVDAGWIMPTPQGTAVSLGDRSVFPKLATATAPRVEKRYVWLPSFGAGNAAGADRAMPGTGAGGVQVSVSQVGPFTVSTLSSTDPDAVNTWLSDHGYPTRPELTDTFGVYLANGWAIQAVKLTSPGGQLAGDLDPLRMTFSASTPVYPILLSKHARDTQIVTLYLVSAHRLEVATPASTYASTTPLFAGRVTASTLGLTPLDGDAVYLTAFTEVLIPDQITGDYTFRQAADDTSYQRVTYIDVDMSGVTMLVVLGLLVAAAIVGGRGAAAEAAADPGMGRPEHLAAALTPRLA